MSLDSFVQELPQLQLLPVPSGPDTFTMVFLDFDDTLMPTRIYRLFANDFCIDIMEVLSKTLLKTLQETIISTIESLKKKFSTKEDHIVFSIVSNATEKWLNYMLKGNKEHNISSRLPILDKYLEDNDIKVVSASAEAYAFLKGRFGDKADEFFANAAGPNNKGNKWMWKNTAFSRLISQHKYKTGAKCRRIISIGDGTDEEKATRQYSKIFNKESLHIRLLRGATFEQLIKQWEYINNNLYKIIINDKSDMINADLCDDFYKHDPAFYVYDLRKLNEFDTDNINGCTGKLHQLPAIESYFHCWMKQWNENGGKAEAKQLAINGVCKAIHARMNQLDAASISSRNLKLILQRAICKNKEFNLNFNRYYRNVQRQSDELTKMKKRQQRNNRNKSMINPNKSKTTTTLKKQVSVC